MELTESRLLPGTPAITSQIGSLTELGPHLVVDDFGAGCCGLGYLNSFEVSKLKIDQSLIQGIGRNVKSSAVVSAIIGIGRALSLKVIAECVETHEQLRFLRAEGCDQVQGHHFSIPLVANAFEKMVQDKAENHTLMLN